MKNFRKTIKNKVAAILLLAIGSLPSILENEAGALVFFGCFAIPLFFSKKDYIH